MARVLPQQPGQRQGFVCPYHQWSYDLKGNLQGIPFKRGVNREGQHAQGLQERGTRPAQVARRHHNGVIFASYSDEVEALEEYLTPAILADFDTVFPGKKLKIHGYYRNELPCNWKMYHENLKDPYHATLLHSFLVVFGLLVAGNKSAMLVDTVHGRHGTMASAKSEDKYASVSEENKKEMRSFHDGLHLQDDRFLEFVKEFDSPWSVTMQTIWPNLIVQREMNTLGVRQIVPNGPDSMIMQWTMFGYEDDTPEMERHRLRQGNLMGPAGFLGLEDNEAMKFVQEGVRRAQHRRQRAQAGIRQAGHQHADLGSRHPLHVQLLPRRDGLLRQERKTQEPDSNFPRQIDPARAIALRLEIEEFHADYCAALDAGQVESWPDFFTEDGLYRVTARENADLGLPVGLVYSRAAP